MKLLAVIFLSFFVRSAFAQDSILISEIDTCIGFFGTKPIHMGDYENRIVPYESHFPLYVCINYEGGKNKNIEYFRVDSTTYLTYEFFKDGTEKSIGLKKVQNEIIGKFASLGRSVASETPTYTKNETYFKKLSKEGTWTENEDATFFYKYCVGDYHDDKRVGIWKYFVSSSDDYLLKEIDYDKDSLQNIYTKNIIFTEKIDKIKSILAGNWKLRYCDGEKNKRMCFFKSNENWDFYNYYILKENGIFKRDTGNGCGIFRKNSLVGNWEVIQSRNATMIQVKFLNKTIWKLNIIFLDNKGNLITERL